MFDNLVHYKNKILYNISQFEKKMDEKIENKAVNAKGVDTNKINKMYLPRILEALSSLGVKVRKKVPKKSKWQRHGIIDMDWPYKNSPLFVNMPYFTSQLKMLVTEVMETKEIAEIKFNKIVSFSKPPTPDNMLQGEVAQLVLYYYIKPINKS